MLQKLLRRLSSLILFPFIFSAMVVTFKELFYVCKHMRKFAICQLPTIFVIMDSIQKASLADVVN